MRKHLRSTIVEYYMNLVNVLDIVATILVGLTGVLWFAAASYFLKKYPEVAEMVTEVWVIMPYKKAFLAGSTVSGLMTVALFHWLGFVMFSTAILATSAIMMIMVGYMIWTAPTALADKGGESY